MVTNANQSKRRKPVNQGFREIFRSLIKSGIHAFDFEARNLTAYGGLLPVATMLENLGSSNWLRRS